MPYEVVKDTGACSTEKPWAVKNADSGKVYGCHASKSDAEDQQAALYANTDSAAAQGAAIEHTHLRIVQAAAEYDAEPPIVTYEAGNIVLATIKDVPLLKIGMRFPASTGDVDFSMQHLSSAASAAADPMVGRPRVKLGHTDPRYNPQPCPNCGTLQPVAEQNDTYFFDGAPNFGFVENMALSDTGGIIRADLVDMPLWLAEIAPVAFPSRSIEGWFGYTGPNMKEYEFIITDLALLGVAFPGIMNLSDLPKMYGSKMPDYVVVQEAA